METGKKLGAEFLGTFWLVLGGCGSAVLAAAVPDVGIGWLGVSLAFGLTVLTMAYAVGHISGGHFNPAVSLGLWMGKRFPARDLLPYIVAQVVGGLVAGGVLFLIASGQPGFDAAASGFAAKPFSIASSLSVGSSHSEAYSFQAGAKSGRFSTIPLTNRAFRSGSSTHSSAAYIKKVPSGRSPVASRSSVWRAVIAMKNPRGASSTTFL